MLGGIYIRVLTRASFIEFINKGRRSWSGMELSHHVHPLTIISYDTHGSDMAREIIKLRT
jgi:hypothetical protein